MSTPSQAFTLSNTHKIVELKTLCMPVFAALVCLNEITKYRLYKQIKSLHSTGVPKLTALATLISHVSTTPFCTTTNQPMCSLYVTLTSVTYCNFCNWKYSNNSSPLVALTPA